jgi:hypothetical protein
MEFRDEVKLQRSVVNGIQQHGKTLLKTELVGIYAGVSADIASQKYKPGKGSNIVGKTLKWIISAGAIGAVAYYVYQNKEHIKIPVENVIEQREDTQKPPKKGNQPQAPSIHRDTVWHIVHYHSGKGQKGDTINAYSEKEMKVKLKKLGNSGNGD